MAEPYRLCAISISTAESDRYRNNIPPQRPVTAQHPNSPAPSDIPISSACPFCATSHSKSSFNAHIQRQHQSKHPYLSTHMGWLFTPVPEELDRGYEADTELPEAQVVMLARVVVGAKRSRGATRENAEVATKKRVIEGRGEGAQGKREMRGVMVR